jgi:type I restriction enzyme S subunit
MILLELKVMNFMRIIKEYKETEIGIIPQDWAVVKLEDILVIKYGKPLKDEDRLIGKIPVYGSNGIVGYHNQSLVRGGGIIIGRKGSAGEVIFSHEDFYPIDTTYFIETDFDYKFIYYLLKNYNIKKLVSSSAVPGLNRNDLYSQQVAMPKNRNEQKQIAEILSSLDDKIELNRKINANLEKIASALFKKWFIDIGDELPEGWEIKPLDGIADFLNGLALQKYPAESETDYLPVIKIRELNNGITETTDKASTKIPEEYILKNGDIIFSWSGSLDVVVWCGGRGALNQHLFKVTSKMYPKWFYYQWIKYFLPLFQNIASDKAVTMGHIKRGHLTESKVLIPDNKTLLKMDELMFPIIETIINNLVEIQNLIMIRDSLLPRLMSGKIRVKNIKL